MRLNEPDFLNEGIEFCKSCPYLGPIVCQHAPPQYELATNPFRALTRIITFQQLSGKAAETIFNRFTLLVGHDEYLAPSHVLGQTIDDLRSIGLSRQKATYIRNIAEQFETHNLDSDGFLILSDEEIREILLPIKGVGQWTVEMFLMFSLCRPDIFSVGDLGLQKGIKPMMNNERVKPNEMLEFAEQWRPWRTLAAYYLWRSLEKPTENPVPRSTNQN